MTEGIKFCRICKNLGIDCEAGTFYCSLSHRPDKLPNTLKCDEFILCDFITRLEQEKKELETKLDVFAFTISNYESALEEILESAKFAQCLPCGSGNLEDCLNCNDDTTNNGQFCMEKRIQDIKQKCVEVLND